MTDQLAKRARLLALCCLAFLAGPTLAADDAQAAQRSAMAKLSILDGTWRGPATVMQPDGRQVEITQTERVGPMLDGALRVVEGRGYLPDGTLHFNALALMSFDPRSGGYTLHSHAQGRVGDFPLVVRADGFSWSFKAGPGTVRYTATVKDGVWHELGEFVMEGQPPRRTFEMTLQRIGSTDWPQAGALAPR